MPPRQHEYLYVSDAKLRQFVPENDSWWRRLRVRKAAGKVAIPDIGEVSIDVEIRDPRLLAWVEAQVQSSARWFEEPVAPGEWVLFEGEVSIQVYDSGPAQGAVVLVQIGGEPGATRRLVMHGSVAHLVGRQRAAAGSSATPNRADPSYSSPADVPMIISAAAAAIPAPQRSILQTFVTALHRAHVPPPDHTAQLESVLKHLDGSELFRASAFSVVAAARVSALLTSPTGLGEVLIASPLFIRNVRPDRR